MLKPELAHAIAAFCAQTGIDPMALAICISLAGAAVLARYL